MNGRMYDPVMGRILSPDIFVQAPGYTQSYNRYSYCMNNPLRYTDPSGWYAATDINTVINELWNTQYGGSWTPGSGAVPYTASEGFGYFAAYNEANGWAAGSSMGSSLSNYFVSDASVVSALGLSYKVTNYDASMLFWQLSPTGLYTNYQSFNNNMSFQLVVDGNNKVVYFNATGFVVPEVSTPYTRGVTETKESVGVNYRNETYKDISTPMGTLTMMTFASVTSDKATNVNIVNDKIQGLSVSKIGVTVSTNASGITGKISTKNVSLSINLQTNTLTLGVFNTVGQKRSGYEFSFTPNENIRYLLTLGLMINIDPAALPYLLLE